MTETTLSPAPISSRLLWIRLAQIAVLFVLIGFVVRDDITRMFRLILREPEAAHAIALLVVIPLVFIARRSVLYESASWTRWAGIVLLLLALGFYLVTQWPYNFGSARRAAIIPAVAAAILTVGGARMFWHTLPIVLMIAVAVPLGSRYYAALVIRPETMTLEIARMLLDLLPGVTAGLEVSDIIYLKGGESGAIALGYKYRGAMMLFPMALVGLYVIYARIRPWWQALVMLVLLGPIVFLGNIVRMFAWGVATIWLDAPPTDGRPYLISVVVALLFA